MSSSPRRILLISEHADPLATPGVGYQGGQNVYVRELATRLARLGAETDVLCRADSPAQPVREQITPGAQVIRVQAGPAGPWPRDRFGEVLDEFIQQADAAWRVAGGYDLVHSHYWYSGLTGLHLAREYGAPLAHSHMSIGAVRRASLDGDPGAAQEALFADRHRAECTLARQADALTAYYPGDAEDQQQMLGASPERLHTVPPGVDTTVHRPLDRREARQRTSLPADVPIVLFTGRLEARKGLADLIAAMPAILRAHPRTRLVVVGGTRHRTDADSAAALTAIRELGLQDQVLMAGSVPQQETAAYYSAADVTVAPSRYEPYGLVAVESLACGVPAVVADVGGLAWIVGDESVGDRVPPRDPDAIAAAVAGVLDRGPGAYHRACLDRVADGLTAEHWVDGIQRMYRAVYGTVRTH
ncbi:glycosyltransferase [Actinomadura rubrisoli]|uniref:Glycosyltransferase n=1 Tax=Actinomadura rubrisoli TaxID=2530368 RepID=A0A4R5BC45_9ACTN|nr:glycosyltransferase [Actinomadura rubrisoli]TDD82769.1 glycosyltransferase [Actinomadura rubrisoli]